MEHILEIKMPTYDTLQRVKLIEFFIPLKDQLFKLRDNTSNILISGYLLPKTWPAFEMKFMAL